MNKTCTDCIHLKVCEDIDDGIQMCYTNYKGCEHFKDKSRYIELPCAVGDTLYVLNDWGYKKELEEKEVGVIVIKGTNNFSKVFWEDVYGGEFGTFADISKTVFLTKEEAEQIIKEREGK